MTWIYYLQDAIAKLELGAPWLLPSLETVEGTVPAGARLLLAVSLMAGWMVLRHQHTATPRRVR